MHGTLKIKCGSLCGIPVWLSLPFSKIVCKPLFTFEKPFLRSILPNAGIQMSPRTPFTWHLLIISKVKVVIHDIIFVFRVRTGISFTWPLSCGKYLPSVLLNIMRESPSQLSNQKRYDFFFKQVWEETTARIDFCAYFCAVHKRLSRY